MILVYATSCNFDSLSDLEPVQEQASGETQDQLEDASANLRVGNFIFEELFEGSTAFSKQSLQFAGGHSFLIVNDPKNSSNKVGKFELRQNDVMVKSGKRAEISFRESFREAWYTYSVYFPTSGFAKDNYPEIITQWHQNGGGSPPNAVQIENDEIYFRSINRSDTDDNSNKVYTNYPLGKVERGKWHQLVFHIVHSPNNDGLIEIWQNNKKMHTIKGPNMRRNYALPGFKLGIYKWTWNKQKTNTDKRVVYFENVKIGNEGALLSDFTSGSIPSIDVDSGAKPVEKVNDKPAHSQTEIITEFKLIQANTDRILRSLSSGDVVTASTHKLNISASTTSSFKGEVRYKLSGSASHTYTDSRAPFTLFGDNGNGDYFFGNGLYPGSYTLIGVPYKDGKVAGKAKQINFTIKR